ncbi:hypothetical protein [Streptomyces griseosporeus]|uniref:hypothetical protein n=1 Tax=Streptomyces griseosporeus TaxID=1910 RepID=UPI00167D7106|nr:hypothetical protein [Streptomyces griseosporeus]GHF90743.1 hypothetical protein GCM10018783_71890 [Streptomyces griseosporeus]
MNSRPWVVVEAPDDRGLRRVTVGGSAAGSVWSLRELRKLLARLGHPDVDVEDPASVCWHGEGSATWPDRPVRRRATMAVMMAGLLASGMLSALIGWPDASGALTFAQRIIGAGLVLAGVVQVAGAVLALDHWGRREYRASGAVVLLGVFIALATDSLLFLLWLEEKEVTPYLFAFVPLGCWAVWAFTVLIREKAWKGLPHPGRFVAGFYATALLSAVSLAYSTLYQPATAPLRFTLNAEFGRARQDRSRDYIHIPLKVSVKNTGDVSVYVVVNDVSVYGRDARYSGDVSKGAFLRAWEKSVGEKGKEGEEAERHVDGFTFKTLSSTRLYEPGDVLEAGQEDTFVHVFQIPRDASYDLIDVDVQFTYMRKDRGRIDVEQYSKPHQSWRHPRFACRAVVADDVDECPLDPLTYHGRVRHNNNLVNVTRAPLYVTAFWAPIGLPRYSISSFHFTGGRINGAADKRELKKFGISSRHATAEVSVAELLRFIPAAPR